MEPNKLENQIQEKLNSREIQPSAQAWDRLDAMLSVSEEKKAKRKFPWLSIAASFTGLFILAVFLISQYKDQKTIINNDANIVNTDKKAEKSSNTTPEVIVENKKLLEKPIPQHRITITENKKQNIEPKTKAIEIQNVMKVPKLPQEIIAEVVPEKVVQKKTLEINPESLLLALENESVANKTNPKSKIKINPSALLSQVDGEIEISFRQKVIKTINKNYNSTKVALATRNLE